MKQGAVRFALSGTKQSAFVEGVFKRLKAEIKGLEEQDVMQCDE